MPDSSYVFCDTDSMAVVAQEVARKYACNSAGGDQVHALSFEMAEQIVERFASLNPYDPSVVSGSILEIEKENFDEAGHRHQLWCLSVSAKRYVLFTWDQEAETVELVKVSEHGLGHLLNPRDPNDDSTRWIDEAWHYLLCLALGVSVEEPAWLDRPALTRVTASGPTVLGWFAAFNDGKDYVDQIKPANFLLLAHPDSLDPSSALPMTPFQRDASKWSTSTWTDRRTGGPVRITVEPSDGMERKGMVRVSTYRDVLAQYLAHPEAKSLGPDGEPVGRNTSGLLLRRPVDGIKPVMRIGKEANKLDERLAGLITDPREYRVEYVNPDHNGWTVLVLPVLITMQRSEVTRRTGLHRRTIERYISGRTKPQRRHEQLLTQSVVDHATKSLRDWGSPGSADPLAMLHRYLQVWPSHQPACRGCGRVLDGRKRSWCGKTCLSTGRSTRAQSEG